MSSTNKLKKSLVLLDEVLVQVLVLVNQVKFLFNHNNTTAIPEIKHPVEQIKSNFKVINANHPKSSNDLIPIKGIRKNNIFLPVCYCTRVLY